MKQGIKYTQEKIKNGFIDTPLGWVHKSKLEDNGLSSNGNPYRTQFIETGADPYRKKGTKYWGICSKFTNALEKQYDNEHKQVLDNIEDDEIDMASIKF